MRRVLVLAPALLLASLIVAMPAGATTLTANNRDITANVRLDFTPRLNMAQNFSSVRVQLTDPMGQWPATIDVTRHVKIWGLMIDRGDGLGWQWFLFQGSEVDPSLWLAFGSRSKSGQLPALSASTDSFGGPGNKIQISILTDASINLGAVATIGNTQLNAATVSVNRAL